MRSETGDRLTLCVIALLLGLPVAATALHSLATDWGATILPDGLTFAWYAKLWQNGRFLAAMGRSMVVCVGALMLATATVLPAAFVVFYRFPALDRLMNVLILLPFVMPPVVASVGLLRLYSDGPLPLTGTPLILFGCYFTVALPFLYRALANAFAGLALHDLMDAAHLLGASTPRAFFLVILPNLRKALLAAAFLSFSFLLGEFVFANILVGTRYETLQVYLYDIRQESGHFTSAVVMSYFLATLALTWLAAKLGSSGSGKR